MAATDYSDTKRCPHCGTWSVHQRRPDDRCTHCHELLDPHGPARDAALQKAWEWEMPRFVLIPIDPAEPLPLRLLKYLVRGGQLLFLATLSFIVWLVTVLTG